MTTARDDEFLVDLLERVWADVAEVCAGLTPEQWALPTDCPGWSVQDNVAHLIGIESTILGLPTPHVDIGDAPHVKNDFGLMNEQWVEHYRSVSGDAVLEEFRRIAARRVGDLRALDDDGFGAESFTPAGPGTVRDLIPFRIYDSWTHELDIRGALDAPADLDSAVAAFCLARAQRPLGVVVGKRVGPPDGTTVVFDVTGRGAFTYALRVEGGRANPIDAPPSDPDVRLTMASETFIRLVNGRVDSDVALADGDVELGGNEELGRAIVTNLNTMI